MIGFERPLLWLIYVLTTLWLWRRYGERFAEAVRRKFGNSFIGDMIILLPIIIWCVGLYGLFYLSKHVI